MSGRLMLSGNMESFSKTIDVPRVQDDMAHPGQLANTSQLLANMRVTDSERRPIELELEAAGLNVLIQ